MGWHREAGTRIIERIKWIGLPGSVWMGGSEAGVGSFSFVPAISYQPFLFVRLADQWNSPLHGEMAEARFLRQIGGAAGDSSR